ncbi:MAG: hypothetical protein L0211_24010 [Planctomycetaceae bacterium]|nr:hypothetical protein [Planctomycetaceae bacterium]
MKNVIGKWIGQNVHVTLRAAMPVTLQGKLLAMDESGVLLELPKGHSFIPLTSILHISLLD